MHGVLMRKRKVHRYKFEFGSRYLMQGRSDFSKLTNVFDIQIIFLSAYRFKFHCQIKLIQSLSRGTFKYVFV